MFGETERERVVLGDMTLQATLKATEAMEHQHRITQIVLPAVHQLTFFMFVMLRLHNAFLTMLRQAKGGEALTKIYVDEIRRSLDG